MIRRKNIKVLRESTNYPSTPVYVIEVTSHDIGGSYTYESFIPKAEYDLGVLLSKLVKEGKVSEKEMVIIERKIEDYGDEKYEDALDNAAMEADS